MRFILELNFEYYALEISGEKADDLIAALNSLRRVDNPYAYRTQNQVIIESDVPLKYGMELTQYPFINKQEVVVEVLAEAKDPHVEAVAGPDMPF